MLSEAAFLGDMPVVLTASRLAQSPLDAPAPVTVIDRDMIRASGFTEIHDLFRLVPGFLVADWPEGSPVVVNHGLGDGFSRRMQVLLDGQSVYDPLRGGVDWQSLPIRLEDIERVEVVRAPNQASYGSNAFMGIINIMTRAPSADQRIGVSVSRGRNGFQDNYVRLGGSTDQMDWRISASQREIANFRDQGVVLSHPIPQDPGLVQTKRWNELVERRTFDAQLSYRPSLDQEWRAHLALGWGGDQVGSNSDYLDPHHEQEGQDRLFRLSWRKTYGSGSELSLSYSHMDRKVGEAYPVTGTADPFPTVNVDKGLEVRRDDVELQQAHVFSDVLKGVWGIGLRQDEAKSGHYLYGLGRVGGTQWQVFGNLDWQVAPKWLLHAGGMLEKHYSTGTLFSPRLAVNYTLAPSHALRASAGRGYRAPTIFEVSAREAYPYNGGVADVDSWQTQPLEPESVDFVELGYVGRAASLGLQVDARVFQEKYRDYIDSQSCNLDNSLCPFPAPAGYLRPSGFPDGKGGRFGHPKAFYFRNSGEITLRGADVSFDWRNPLLGRVVLVHAVTQISARGVDDVDRDRDIEDSAPQQSTSLLWSKELFDGFRTSVGYYYVGYMKWPNDGDEQPAYRRVDVKLAKRLGKRGSEDELALTWQNLTGAHSEFDEYMVERQAFITLRLAW